MASQSRLFCWAILLLILGPLHPAHPGPLQAHTTVLMHGDGLLHRVVRSRDPAPRILSLHPDKVCSLFEEPMVLLRLAVQLLVDTGDGLVLM